MNSPENSDQVLRVDNIADSESFESPINSYYRGKPYHRGRDVGVYDINKMVEKNKACLVRSTQEHMISASGMKRTLFWVNAIFDMGDGIFWHATVKTNNYNTGNAFEGTYTIIVYATEPIIAAEQLELVSNDYGSFISSDSPTFNILREHRGQPISVEVDQKFLLEDDELDLHYGEGFTEWSEKFTASLPESGLSILQGAPGTGKTSYLRHLICKNWETHRFYYIPVESFHLLSSSTLPNIWNQEERNYPKAIKVIILEDAERLLLEREGQLGGETASLLNLTDGFIGDLVRVHLVCTVNSDLSKVDEALMRPGRQKFFKEFKKLEWTEAKTLAEHLDIGLSEERTYTLAEIFNLNDTKRAGEDQFQKEEKKIGFS